MQSLEGCPKFTTNQLFIFMDYIKTILALIIIVPASFLLVFGRDKIFISSAICSHLLLMYTIAYVLYTTILRKNRNYTIDGVAFVIVNAICAGLSAYLAKMQLKIAIQLMITLGTIILAIQICTVIQLAVGLIQIIVIILAALASVYLGFKRPHDMMILSSSLIGAYFAVRAAFNLFGI